MLSREHSLFWLKKLAIASLPLVLLAFFAWFWLHRQPPSTEIAVPPAWQNDFAGRDLALKVARLAVVPNEIPAIKQLSAADINPKLMFWQQVQPGQWLLAFSGAGKALVYDEAKDRIIRYDRWTGKELGLPALPKVELRNGSTELGKAAALAERLASERWSVSDVRPAADTDYEFSQIFFLTDAGRSLAEPLQALVQASSSQAWPEQEEKTSADVVIIVGRR